MKKIIYIILIILTIFLIENSYKIYKTDILKITNITENELKTKTNTLGIKEKHYNQNIKGIILKTNKKILLTNQYSSSQVLTEKYTVGDELFIENNQIISLRRDKYLYYSLLILIILLLSIYKKRGLNSCISILINIIIFILGIFIYNYIKNIILLSIFYLILFPVISLLITNKINKKTVLALISTMITIIIITIFLLLITKITNYNKINFNELEYIIRNYKEIYLFSLILGTLGVIMDICVTITSSLYEIKEKNKNITNKQLIKSGKNIGSDIIISMTNVIFFTFLSSCLPSFVLQLRNKVTLINYLQTNFSVELSRFLIGAIGILLSILISTYITVKAGDKK